MWVSNVNKISFKKEWLMAFIHRMDPTVTWHSHLLWQRLDILLLPSSVAEAAAAEQDSNRFVFGIFMMFLVW